MRNQVGGGGRRGGKKRGGVKKEKKKRGAFFSPEGFCVTNFVERWGERGRKKRVVCSKGRGETKRKPTTESDNAKDRFFFFAGLRKNVPKYMKKPYNRRKNILFLERGICMGNSYKSKPGIMLVGFFDLTKIFSFWWERGNGVLVYDECCWFFWLVCVVFLKRKLFEKKNKDYKLEDDE